MHTVPEDRVFFDDLVEGNGAAGRLNEAILALPQFRIFVHRRSGSDPIAQATRMIIAALIKHGGLTAEVRSLAEKIGAGSP